MAKVSVRPGVGDKVKVVGGNTRKDEEGIIYKDDGVGDSRPYKIEFSDGKSDDWFEEAHVELLEKGKGGKVSMWRSESWMLMTPY
jgi:hypothetical protein